MWSMGRSELPEEAGGNDWRMRTLPVSIEALNSVATGTLVYPTNIGTTRAKPTATLLVVIISDGGQNLGCSRLL